MNKRALVAVGVSLLLTGLLPGIARGATSRLDPGLGARVVTIDLGPGKDEARALVVQPDGMTVVVGSTEKVAGQFGSGDIAVLRFQPDGRLDADFGVGGRVVVDHLGDDQAAAVALQPDGKIVVVGKTMVWNAHQETYNMVVVRLEADGRLDTTFDGGIVTTAQRTGTSSSEAMAVTLQPDGGILVAGTGHLFQILNDTTMRSFDLMLVRLLPDGTIDGAFGENGVVVDDFDGYNTQESASSVSVLPDGRILLAGTMHTSSFTSTAAPIHHVLARYSSSGVPDTTFGTGGQFTSGLTGNLSAAFVRPDGRIIVAGDAPGSSTEPRAFAVTAYRPDGGLAVAFGTGGTTVTPAPSHRVGSSYTVGASAASAMAVDARGRLVVAGFAAGLPGVDLAVARYTAVGALDTTFGRAGWMRTDVSGANDYLQAVGLLPDGHIVAAGYSPPSGNSQIVLAVFPADDQPTGPAAWGWNPAGALGDGTTIGRVSPIDVPAPSSAQALSGGAYHSLALDDVGNVTAWGWNAFGQVGDGTTVDRHSPVAVPGLIWVTSIAGGHYHSLAVSGGRPFAWGWNVLGELGDGTTVDRHTPVPVVGLTDVVTVAAGGFHSLALRKDGTVWAWGWNGVGQLGDGTTVNHSTPVAVAGLTHVVAISAGAMHSLAVTADGTVWAWGWNGVGQLGDGTTVDRPSPVPVGSAAVAIAAGAYHSLALSNEGGVSAWGWNVYGQLGDGSTVDRPSPVRLTGLPETRSIAAGGLHSLALGVDGSTRSWGWNAFGQLGDGSIAERHAPVLTSGLLSATAVAAGIYHTLAPRP